MMQVSEDVISENVFWGKDEVEIFVFIQIRDFFDYGFLVIVGGVDWQGGFVGDEGVGGEVFGQ